MRTHGKVNGPLPEVRAARHHGYVHLKHNVYMTRSDLWGHSFKMYYACKIYYSKDHKVRFLKYAKILVLTNKQAI